MSLPKKLLKALEVRDGRACAWHPEGMCDPETLVPQHRSNRGMGGRKSLNRLSNVVLLCSSTNSLIESDSGYADQARGLGIKISSHAEPSKEPITHAVHGRVYLDDLGGVA